MNPELAFKIANLPESPGCYMMKSRGTIIYVGKAKNLKNRVRQYFQAGHDHTPKVRAMVEKIDDFEIMLVDGELEAFILECNLIKRHMPWYNILLKDDKHYPFIRIDTSKPYPLVELVRKQEKDGAKYYGPYQGATVVREVLDVVRSVFPIRTCTRTIAPAKPQRPCIHHQIGQCLAPCAGNVPPEQYQEIIRSVMEFLGGKYEPVLSMLRTRMAEAAKELNYERAASCRDKIRSVEAVMQKQKAITSLTTDQDVLAVCPEGPDALVQMMYIRSGRMIGSEHFVLERAGDELPGEVLTQFMLQYYSEDAKPPHEILLSHMPPEEATLSQLLSELAGRRVYISTPHRGEKYALVNMAVKNVKDFAEKRTRRMAKSYERTVGAVEELRSELGMTTRPRRIEGYDISNTQGVLSVGSMVVMIDGICANKEYRIFNIKTVEGPNDFASMHETLTRRLKHGLEEKAERERQGLSPIGGKFSDMPDLILIDGGRGQLNAAMDAQRALGLNIPMFGLAKRIEEIVLPDQEASLLLDRRSEALHLIQRLRDEAHRNGITRHRKLRQSHAISSRLEEIPGIGPKRRTAILKHFKTVEDLKNADVETIAQVPGLPVKDAEAVYRYLHKDDLPEEEALTEEETDDAQE